ncbi:MAG: sigma-E processing peptidase SpoIIGA, partial [Lachnospiraceae bacterium]|nr:sigma-E processing peptidase SpoIIGA [Lachnospiraceae bacterium]
VGKEHGLLEGIVVDELIIQKEREQVVKKGAVIAFYKGKLSKNGEFQMILNHSLIG